MKRSEEFHMARLAPGYYAGHGYEINRHENGREWNIHYPGDDGEPRPDADDVVSSLSTAKEWARAHWEENKR